MTFLEKGVHIGLHIAFTTTATDEAITRRDGTMRQATEQATRQHDATHIEGRGDNTTRRHDATGDGTGNATARRDAHFVSSLEHHRKHTILCNKGGFSFIILLLQLR